MTTTMETTKTYYRTLHGNHRHLNWYCANTHRAVTSGDVLVMTAAEVPTYMPCSKCAADELAAWDQAEAAESKRCPNSRVKHPQRFMSTCVDCGKEGKPNRSTSRLRAHDRKEDKK